EPEPVAHFRAPVAEEFAEESAVMPTTADEAAQAASDAVPHSASHEVEVQEVQPEQEAPGSGTYNFRPGSGVVEEEEISEDEHEYVGFSEGTEEGEFEELEEETLDAEGDQKEDEVLAAGEELAKAFAASRQSEQ